MKDTIGRIGLWVVGACFCTVLYGQAPLSIQQCETLFQQNNLQLIAARYEVDAARAGVIQARIWDHPYISGELNLYNPERNRFFDAGKDGEKMLAIEQLIALGRKKKEVNLAKGNVELAELQLEDLLRNLRFRLRESYYNLYFGLSKINLISTQLANVDSLTHAYDVQAIKGNVPLKDVARLQSLSLSLKNELLLLKEDIFENQQMLQFLTGAGEDIQPLVESAALDTRYFKEMEYSLQQLYEIALIRNTDYLVTQKIFENNELMMKWQKSLAAPDLKLGLSYDQIGGAFRNQANLSVGIPLVLWNRNRGNIKIAQTQVSQSKVLIEQKALELKSRINATGSNLAFRLKEYASLSGNIWQNLQQVYDGTLHNFQQRNISIIEFSDFMESYNQSVLLHTEMKRQIVLASEELNLLANENIF